MTPKIEIIVCRDARQLAREGAEIFRREGKEAIDRCGDFAVALSGGTTPRAMLRQLAQPVLRRRIPWAAVHLFWVDERMVSRRHPHSNYGCARADLLEHVPVPAANLHPMPVDGPPPDNAAAYQRELETFFRDRRSGVPSFDLVFLGVGTDGHTASLFPGRDAETETSGWVLAVRGGVPDVRRLTLSYSLLNRARRICFMAGGRAKAEVVHRVLEGSGQPLPAEKINPPDRRLTWLLDRAAASRLIPEFCTKIALTATSV